MTLGEAGRAVAAGGDRGAAGIALAFNAVAEILSDLIETAGNALQDGATALGARARVAHGPLEWAGGSVSGVFDLAAAIVKSSLDAAGAVLAGAVRLVAGGAGGAAGRDFSVAKTGARDVAAGIAGGLIVVLGKLVSALQGISMLQARRRALSPDEKKALGRVFGGAVALFNVRIVEGRSGIFGVNHRPFTLGNTIYMKGSLGDRSTLVHEATHVWQFQQRGSRYAADALGAQLLVEEPYDWQREIERGNREWNGFNAEAQAELVRDVYRSGRKAGAQPSGQGEFFDARPPEVQFTTGAVDHTPLATGALATLRARRAFRASRRLA